MKLTYLILPLLSLAFLSACQKNRQVNPNTAGSVPTSPTPTSAPTSEPSRSGPSDGGGGDTCNNKMIESYRVDIETLEEYQTYIIPILKRIEADPEKKISSSPFLISTHLRNWYLIDCKLNEVPKERKGLYLETYQTAIHTNREVFIESGSYKKMEKEEKAKLLFHEMVMAFYLMKYNSLEELCRSRNSCDGGESTIANWKQFKPLPYKPLDESDHQLIRNVTAWLWEQRETLTHESFSKILKSNGFDTRFENLPTNEEPVRQNEELSVTTETLIRMFKKLQHAGTDLKYCQFDDSKELMSKSTCTTETQVDVVDGTSPYVKMKNLSLKLKITRKSDGKVFQQEFMYPLDKDQINLYANSMGPMGNGVAPWLLTGNWLALASPDRKEGMRTQNLTIFIDLKNPVDPTIVQILFHTHVWYEFKEEVSTRDGKKTKAIVGYRKLMPEESETLFSSDQLPYKMKFEDLEKQTVYSEQYSVSQ